MGGIETCKSGDLVMDASETASKRRRKRKKWCIYVLLLFFGAVAFTLFRLHLKSKLNARIEAIRAAGYPVTCDELEAFYTIPEGVENAADTILDATKSYFQWSLKTIPDVNYLDPYHPFYTEGDLKVLPHISVVELPTSGEPLTDAMKALITEYVVDNNEALELLHAAAKIEHSRFPFELKYPHKRGFSRYQCDNVSRLLCFDAFVHAENGNSELAVRSVISTFGLARSLSKEPMLESQITLINCDWKALYALKRIVNRIQLTDKQMVKLSKCIAQAEHVRDFSLALIGEQCLKLRLFSEPRKWAFDEEIRLPSDSILKAYEALGLVDMDAIHYLDRMAKYIEVSRLPIHYRWEAARIVDDEFGVPSRIRFLLFETTFGIFALITVDFRNIARLRTACAGLAVQRYRLANGAIPDTLSQLVPAYLDTVPKDPFDDNDLRYIKRGNGFVIYSIGEDLRDDDGKEKPKYSERKTNPNWDVTFIVER